MITRAKEIVAGILWYGFILLGAACAIFLPIQNAIAGPNP